MPTNTVKAILRKMFVSETNLERLGGKCGWHIKPELLASNSVCVSGGAGLDVSFERELAERFGVLVLIYDPSPAGVGTCKSAIEECPSLKHFPLGIAGRPGELAFTEPLPHDGESYQATLIEDGRKQVRLPCTTISEIVRTNGISNACLLKLDIEGCEYEALEDLLAHYPNLFPQIAVEFHHRLPGMNVWRQRFRTAVVVLKLRFHGYRLVRKVGGDFTFLKAEHLLAVQ